MTPKRQDTAQQDLPGIGGEVAVFVDTYAGWQGLVEMGVQEYFAPHECRSADVENHRAILRGEAEAERVRGQRRARPARWDHMRLRTGEVHADQASFDDHFHIVGIAPAVVAVVHPNHGKLLRSCLVDGDLSSAVHRYI